MSNKRWEDDLGTNQQNRDGTPATRRIEAAAKRKLAVELRMAGRTWEDIAQQCGYSSRMSAHQAVKESLQQTIADLSHTVEEYRTLELERLDALIRANWEEAEAGNIRAGDLVLKLITARGKLLNLEAPAKVEISGGVRYEVVGWSPPMLPVLDATVIDADVVEPETVELEA